MWFNVNIINNIIGLMRRNNIGWMDGWIDGRAGRACMGQEYDFVVSDPLSFPMAREVPSHSM